MRKWFGPILVGLGAFSLLLAILLPVWVVPQSKKIPLDLNITQISSGPAKLLNADTGETDNVTLRATRLVRTDSSASDSTYTTVDESLCIVVVQGNTPNCVPSTDKRLLSYSTDRVTVDRKSGEAVNIAKYHENVNGDTSVQHKGMAYAFPIDTQKKTYEFFNPDINQASPAKYAGEETIQGMKTYKFVSESGNVPYKILDTFPGTYNDTRTVWVEPRTGVIIDGVEHQVQTMEDGTVALDTTLRFEQSSIDYQKNFAQTKIDEIQLAKVWAPIGLTIVGLLLLGGGVFLMRGSSSGDSGPQPEGEPVPVGGPPGDDGAPFFADAADQTGPIPPEQPGQHRG